MCDLVYFIMSVCVASLIMLAFMRNSYDKEFFDYLLFATVGTIAGVLWPVTIMLSIIAMGLLFIDHVIMK